jgi:hypothetical protein
LTIVVLAALGLRRTDETAETAKHAETRFSLRSLRSPRFLLLVAAAALIVTLLLGFSIRLPGIKITSLSRALLVCAACGGIVLAASRRTRAAARQRLLSPAGVFSAITLFAIVMSFGPEIRAKGRVVTTANVYSVFYDLVPGFDGLRVPARYATIVTLGLAALAAIGVAAIDRRHQGRVATVAGALILLEAIAVPIPINQNSTGYTQSGLAPLPASLAIGSAAPEVYRFAAQLPAPAVHADSRLGEPASTCATCSTPRCTEAARQRCGGASPRCALTESLKDVARAPTVPGRRSSSRPPPTPSSTKGRPRTAAALA